MWYGLQESVKTLLLKQTQSTTLQKHEFWALQNISFSLTKGQSLGIIGENGAGKTTLLKLICGLLNPSSGYIKTTGRIASLLSLSAGYQTQLNAIENISLHLAILGLSAKEIKEQTPLIIKFSELEESATSPLRTYSSGMIARLAFSTVIHANPDCLLIDEVLAVGDLPFQIKCYKALAELKQSGCCFILVSHNLNSIIEICDRALFLQNGIIQGIGNPNEIVALYKQSIKKTTTELAYSENKEVEIINCNWLPKILETNRNAHLNLTIKSNKSVHDIEIRVLVKQPHQKGEYLLDLKSTNNLVIKTLETDKNYEIELKLDSCKLQASKYLYKVIIQHSNKAEILAVADWREFEVISNENDLLSLFHQDRSWKIK